MNQTLRLIHDRCSLRRYRKAPLGRDRVEAILDAALRAPTAGNMMLYTILEITLSETKAALARTCGHGFIAEAPTVLVFLADMQRWVDYYDAYGVPEECAARGEPMQRPDLGKLFLGCCDAMAAAQTSVIAAESLGVGSCYVGDIMGDAETHRDLLGLPRWSFPVALVCYGDAPPDATRTPTARFDRRFIVFRDRYKRLSKAELDEMLSDVAVRFADVLRTHGVSLAAMTYRHFSAGAAAGTLGEQVARQLEPWRDRLEHALRPDPVAPDTGSPREPS